MKKNFILMVAMILVVAAFFVNSYSSTPTDSINYAAYGVVKGYSCETDTIKSATDSAVIMSEFKIPGQQKGCVFVLVIPKVYGAGNDSTKAYLGVTGYDDDGNVIFAKYITGDTLKDSTAKRFVLPIETPIAPADKYRLVLYGYTHSGGEVIFKNCKIYALKLFSRKD